MADACELEPLRIELDVGEGELVVGADEGGVLVEKTEEEEGEDGVEAGDICQVEGVSKAR